MAKQFPCPRCRNSLEVPAEFADETLTCPRCLAEIPRPRLEGITTGPAEARHGPEWALRCPGCGEDVQPSWRACPHCGRRLDLEREVARTSLEGDTRRDTKATGLLLILLASAGCITYVSLACSGTLRMSPDSFVNLTMVVGFVLIVVVITGMVLSSRNRDASTSLAGGLLGGLSIAGIILLFVAAFVIYAINDCLKGCKLPSH